MRIAFIAPGTLPVPTPAYGGIELVVWNYYQVLVDKGHEVHIVNVRRSASRVLRKFRKLRIICKVNSFKPDLVHIMTPKYFRLQRYLRCRNVFLTDHAAKISLPNQSRHRRALRKGAHVVCLSERIRGHYLAIGVAPDLAHVVPNGVMTEQYRFVENPKFSDRSIYLALVDQRKRQYLFCGIPGLDFVGPIFDKTDFTDENYLGEWSRAKIAQDLTEYANLVLLSEMEAAPMVVLEALASGLGLVISETAAVNLDVSLPFIDVIPEDKIHDRDFVACVIAENRVKALGMRKQIREYAVNNFDVAKIIENRYLPLANSTVTGRRLNKKAVAFSM